MIVGIIGAAVVGLFAQSAAPTGWQAVAYSTSTGQDGYAFNRAAKADAEAKALEACQASDCQLLAAADACLTVVRNVAAGGRDSSLVGLSDISVIRSPYEAQTADLTSEQACDASAGCEVVRDVCLEVVRPTDPRS